MNMNMNNLSLNDITKSIKSNKDSQFPDIRVTSDFQQSFIIPENMISQEVAKVTKEHQEKSSNHTTYKFIENELLDMPLNFSEFLDMNKYYIYGCKNLIESFIYIFDNDYKLEKSSNKKQKLEEFYLKLLGDLHKTFLKYKVFFNEKKIKRTQMDKLIKDVFIEDSNLDNNDKMDMCYFICNMYIHLGTIYACTYVYKYIYIYRCGCTYRQRCNNIYIYIGVYIYICIRDIYRYAHVYCSPIPSL